VNADVIDKLERLQKLRDSGVITQAELDTEKAALLSSAAAGAVVVCAGCGAPIQLNALGRCVYCGAPGPAGAGPASSAGSPDELADRIYAAHPDQMIVAIKELRAETGLDLKDAKKRIEAARARAGAR
jgi:hypothetical protein